jgi:hypothetical protein
MNLRTPIFVSQKLYTKVIVGRRLTFLDGSIWDYKRIFQDKSVHVTSVVVLEKTIEAPFYPIEI